MILYKGDLYENSKQCDLLKTLYDDCLNTLSRGTRIDSELVINACGALYKKLINHQFDDIVLPLLKTFDVAEEEYYKVINLLSPENLRKKVERELGKDRKNIYPLGILFHIAAGNFDVLPAFSVVEGLLAGNINILKLPTGDSGVSTKLLKCLTDEEPILKEYIYVFDIPSVEVDSLKTITEFSNGIVVWGGDAANKAAREFAPINSKIISWGHKISFAYVTKDVKDEDLYRLGQHICVTNQVLCSSCQGIFVDTENDEVMEEVGKRFFEQLKKASKDLNRDDLGMIGKNTFQLYSKSLEEDETDIILNEDGVSVIIKKDSELELSYMFRNVWIKKLPRNKIVTMLHKHKNHLQTVMLFCTIEDKDELNSLLINAGLTKVSKLDASLLKVDEAHDGEYPLMRYSKIVEIE